MTIDLPVGTKVKLGGKHCIVTPIEEDEDKDYLCNTRCALSQKHFKCCGQVSCLACDRSDKKEIYFKEIV